MGSRDAPAHAAPPSASVAPGCASLPGELGPTPPAVQGAAAPASPEAPARQPVDVASLVERLAPVVVSITVKERSELGEDPHEELEHGVGPGASVPEERTGLASGFIVDPSGFVVTNEHVVEDATAVRVTLADRQEVEARVIGRDAGLDVAVLRIAPPPGSRLRAATFGSSDSLRVGEPVIAMGNPFGLGPSTTVGVVSAKQRSIGIGPYDDFIQTDAPMNPGNSGGPLFDAEGRVVGMAIAVRTGSAGIGFAIPADAIERILPELLRTGRVDRGKLGASFQTVTAPLARALGVGAPRGALIADVEPGASAARAGMRAGDVVLAVDGAAIRTPEELTRAIAWSRSRARLRLTVWRGDRARDVTVTLDASDPKPPSPDGASRGRGAAGGERLGALGVRVFQAPGGVFVVGIDAGIDAGDLELGDAILEVGGETVTDVRSLRERIARARPGTSLLLRVKREGELVFAAIPVPGR